MHSDHKKDKIVALMADEEKLDGMMISNEKIERNAEEGSCQEEEHSKIYTPDELEEIDERLAYIARKFKNLRFQRVRGFRKATPTAAAKLVKQTWLIYNPTLFDIFKLVYQATSIIEMSTLWRLSND